MRPTLLDAAKAAVEKMDALHKAFGAPGDYGYGTKEGDALFELCRAAIELSNAIQRHEQVDA